MSGVLGVPALTLGDFAFASFEVPETISWGGMQRLHVHQLPGGNRVIDTFGHELAPITWRGMMISADAAQRAQALDDLCGRGEVVELTWGEFSYSVVVEKFEADYRRSNWIGSYSISCAVLPDPMGDEDDDQQLGDGAEPTTQAKAVEQGQASIKQARATSAAMPTPPSVQPIGTGGTSIDVRLA